MNAAPLAKNVLLSAKVEEAVSATEASGSALMLLVRRSIRRTGLVAITLTVKDMVPVTF